jgi:predicted TIM-barrel fold metal-dependent hydrolase
VTGARRKSRYVQQQDRGSGSPSCHRHATVPLNPTGENHMRIVALEEHYTVPRIVAGISPGAIARRGFPTDPNFVWAQTTKRNELADLGDARLVDMDASGITTQVLSVAGPGADLVPGQPGIDLARAYNDALAEACARHPTRYRGFAHLPMLAPESAADELERTAKDLGFHGALVNGATDGRFLDDPAFEPILARAEKLDLPIYLHPGIPTEPVRNAYYDNLPGNFSFTLALSAWGWHADTAIHTLRLALSGALDRHPGLKISSATWARRCRSCSTASTKPPPPPRRCTSGARCGRPSSIRCGSPPAGSSPWCRSRRR